ERSLSLLHVTPLVLFISSFSPPRLCLVSGRSPHQQLLQEPEKQGEGSRAKALAVSQTVEEISARECRDTG
ncbi:hypothetical protein F5887DRAFT_999468, partial [Amanita rubescens]